MPPRRGESVERGEEHERFIKKLSEYHEKRGYVSDDFSLLSRPARSEANTAAFPKVPS